MDKFETYCINGSYQVKTACCMRFNKLTKTLIVFDLMSYFYKVTHYNLQ